MYPLRKTVGNFFSAKSVGISLMILVIPVVFYSYTVFTDEILAVSFHSGDPSRENPKSFIKTKYEGKYVKDAHAQRIR